MPGVILALMFAPALWMVLDQRAGVLDALRMSREATHGNKLTLLALWLVAFLPGVLVIVCTCGLGVIFVQPFWFLLWCVSYLSMTGQTTVEDAVIEA